MKPWAARGGETLKRATLVIWSLRTKLLLFSLLLVLAPGAVFGLIAISNGRRAITEAVGRQLADAARSAADSLSGTMQTDFEALRTLARQDLMREIRIGDLDKRISAFLVSLQRAEPSILELRVTDLGGRVIAASNPARLGQTDGMPPPVANGAPSGESLRGPFPSPGDQRSALELAVPIPDPDRKEVFVGRLSALYDWSRATQALKRVRQNLLDSKIEAELLVTDPAGRVIASTGGQRIGADLRASGWKSVDPVAEPRLTGFAVERHPRVLVGYTRLVEPRWSVLVVEPSKIAFRPVLDMTIGLAIGLAAVLAIALGLALVFASRIASPLRELTRATEEITHGDGLAPVVPIRSRDEVGQLAAAFNRMSADLERAQNEVLDAAKLAFVGELAAGVAHEVRTALGVLRSSVQILQPSVAAGEREDAELVQIMLEEIDHLDGVVTQLLHLGRPRQPAVAPTRLCDVILRATDFVEPQARAKGVSIRRVASTDGPVVVCDEEQIYQVALNLLVNSVHVLPQGGEITVSLLPERSRMAGFEVRDNGPGIPDDIRQKIFLPFFTRRDGGIGFGLAFVQRVVREHKGKLSVESEVGRGATFRIELPVSEARE